MSWLHTPQPRHQRPSRRQVAAAIALAGCNGTGSPGGGLAGPDSAPGDPFTAGGKDILPRAAYGLLNDKAADMLRGMGYTRVRQLAGGIEAWKKDVLAVVREKL